jgi:hypothetical protein
MKAILLKYKAYFIGFVILCFVSLVVQNRLQRKSIDRQNERIGRLTSNIDQLLQENVNQTSLILTQKEVTGKVKRERDSLAKALQITPKQVVKYVDRVIIQRDTVVKEIPVIVTGDHKWSFIDNGDCYVYKADVFYTNDTIHVKKTGFSYTNKIVDVFYWKRRFWIFSKKKYFQETSQSCGSSSTKSVTFIKK